jgi:hypothetical protein
VLSTITVLATVSKTPFYVAGIVLALWAVVLAAIGLSRPNFPENVGGSRVVMGISFVLMLAVVATAVHTSTFEH